MTEEIVLPHLSWRPTAASGARHGHPVELVVVHRWGGRYFDESAEKVTYEGVIRYFSDPANQASAHVVFPGSAAPGYATQMVAWADYAWAEAAYNPVADDLESADAIWLEQDAEGFRVLARMVACRLNERGLPPVWSSSRGFCRHADLGVAGGDHLACPTTDLGLWRDFVRLVQAEHVRGHFRRPWGR